jgi:hypothetical protein
MFGEKRPELAPKIEEKMETRVEAPEVLRIASCGQPRLTPAGSLEIPMTLEMNANGREKRLAVSLNVAIHLDQLPTQGS